MPLSSKILHSLLVKIVKIGQHLVNIWSSAIAYFWPPCIIDVFYMDNEIWGNLVQ